MKLAACILTRDDGPALTRTLESLTGAVDHVYTSTAPILGASHLGDEPAWTTQSRARDAMLQLARADGHDWILAIDGDEALHRGGQLRDWLEWWGEPAFPIRSQPDPGWWIVAPWKVLRVDAWRRHAAQSAYLETMSGETVHLVAGLTDGPGGLPYLTHHAELRPKPRARLSEVEAALEPAPLDAVDRMIRAPLARAATVPGMSETYYCPGCGKRYDTPGECVNEHPPVNLEPLPVDTPQAPVEPADGSEAAAPSEQAPGVVEPAPPAAPPVAG